MKTISIGHEDSPVLVYSGLNIFYCIRGFVGGFHELAKQRSVDRRISREALISRQSCWTKQSVDRLVIVVLDALRFDFVAPSTFFQDRKPWMDKLPVLHKLATRPGSSARIFKAIADPPTTSLQRLKGLTTGGLPTFIDVGNSFGAPAIIEDNLIYQMVQNEKRVLMMGDDTWVQLFPKHFNKSFPFPSFNVKDLHTVDNGCIEHIFPSLYKDDWDVLIAHFLGVDHAGHISGVDSTQMIEKLEQYNTILEQIVDVLESQSGPGGLHENTMLLVMGDHGQTVNGDHGGGTDEEVETSLFAMSFKKPPFPSPLESDTLSCQLDLDGNRMCISSIQQLDFAVTVSALLGIPYPFGSIGRVNAELYSLAAGTWNSESFDGGSHQDQLEKWMQNYVNVLCINAWQVMNYIDVYSASSLIGFSDKDLSHIDDLYDLAQNMWSHTKDALVQCGNGNCSTSLPSLKEQINAYSNILASITTLARSKWTEFNLKMMGAGFAIMLLSLLLHIIIITKLDKQCGLHFPYCGNFRISFEVTFAYITVLIRAFSPILKRAQFPKPFFTLVKSHCLFFYEKAPSLPNILLYFSGTFIVYKSSYQGISKYIVAGTICSYLLIAVDWAMDTNLFGLSMMNGSSKENWIPRIVYLLGILQVSFLAIARCSGKQRTSDWERCNTKTLSMLFAWSSTIIILSGKQGPLIFSWWLMGLEETVGSTLYSPPVTKWSLLAVCLFFCTGHWCTFDGLRYPAAFVGFDEFNLVRQAVLLTIDTFGFSHIVPIIGLPFLVACQRPLKKTDQKKQVFYSNLLQVYLIYGLTLATTTTLTILSVAIQRRHLMVWGLFAPKFVFDALGLLLTDFLICLASLYYFTN
nr:GPI ethanolamine phosphate transferase 3 [Ipomoea batatas]